MEYPSFSCVVFFLLLFLTFSRHFFTFINFFSLFYFPFVYSCLFHLSLFFLHRMPRCSYFNLGPLSTDIFSCVTFICLFYSIHRYSFALTNSPNFCYTLYLFHHYYFITAILVLSHCLALVHFLIKIFV